jgi:hypothetical protein
MSRLIRVLALVAALALGAPGARADESGKKFHDAAFLRYEGAQSWPTGERAQVVSDFAVPIYLGLPNKPYTVLGRIYDERTSGIGIMTRAFSEGLFSERDRQRDCADQAKFRGGDAVLVTNDERVIKALGVSRDELQKTTPLFQHKDSATLVIKFD